jgi:hypothetical protein
MRRYRSVAGGPQPKPGQTETWPHLWRAARGNAILTAMADPKPDPCPSEKTPAAKPSPPPAREREIGGPKGPEPTRYGDWETNGRCTDF